VRTLLLAAKAKCLLYAALFHTVVTPEILFWGFPPPVEVGPLKSS